MAETSAWPGVSPAMTAEVAAALAAIRANSKAQRQQTRVLYPNDQSLSAANDAT